ncbi:type III-B CRISPR-associated protein Cas10/Cmr2 [Almyronema epifaneia]|uniref:Type III-B CRISPR-associated protein Cas10/Cmr2 n=1 Tax=Almyronema epifaneia S1 TaxID=2991925 RepID=A0ABW6IJH6_9CYAN
MVNGATRQSPACQPTAILEIGLAWCFAWGEAKIPQVDIHVLRQMRRAIKTGEAFPEAIQLHLKRIIQLNHLDKANYPENAEALTALVQKYPDLWNKRIGLVYGGATKIKQYVFEASKLQDIRGGSALLDRINLIDLPAFFKGEEAGDRFPQCARVAQYCQQLRTDWLQTEFPGLQDALIPELIVYSTGGNILAFCPVAYTDDLANAIEKRYTTETLTANSCAVGQAFRFLELRYGLLKDPIEQTPWLDWYLQNATQPLVEALFGKAEDNLTEQFKKRKSFNELVRQLAVRFNQRRSGDDRFRGDRPSRRYPPMLETHPYVQRDQTENRSAVQQIKDKQNRRGLPGEPWFSDVLARKRVTGQTAKRDNQNKAWFKPDEWLGWHPGELESWTTRYDDFLQKHAELAAQYNPKKQQLQDDKKEARSLREIGNASSGFVGYIYADGNNMGGYIQTITTAEDYQQFSEAVSVATEHAVYYALAKHLEPHQLAGINDPESENRNGTWIHPFEILTIGGDDVMLVVPANKALAIAQTLCKQFETLLVDKNPAFRRSQTVCAETFKAIHRYQPQDTNQENSNEPPPCELSMSAGVLITAQDTPIYYAEKLTTQLLKSAKNQAKHLKKEHEYFGGTIDFLAMKAVTMLSSNIQHFREYGLVFGNKPKRKLYGAPYTLHDIKGLLKTAKALKKSDFPRSQLYQIRSLLERGKHTAMLNYRYFRVRLDKEKQELLQKHFEDAWCSPKDPQNGGNLAPWMSIREDSSTTYETIWRELVDLYPFTDKPEQADTKSSVASQEV